MTSKALVREPEFAARLRKSCDERRGCPPLNAGRLIWIQENLARVRHNYSVESVRKWLAGESKPREKALAAIAHLLDVDEAWLSLGADPGLTRREVAAHSATADGGVNVVAGLIQMDGGRVEFGERVEPDDPVDIRAKILAAEYKLHIASGTQTEAGLLQFLVPIDHSAVIVLGVVREGFAFEIFELTPELVAAHLVRGAGRGLPIKIEVTRDAISTYQIRSFRQRL